MREMTQREARLDYAVDAGRLTPAEGAARVQALRAADDRAANQVLAAMAFLFIAGLVAAATAWR